MLLYIVGIIFVLGLIIHIKVASVEGKAKRGHDEAKFRTSLEKEYLLKLKEKEEKRKEVRFFKKSREKRKNSKR